MTSEESRECSEPQVCHLINGDSNAFVLVFPGSFMLNRQKRRTHHQQHRVHWDAFFHTPQCPTHLVAICVFPKQGSGCIHLSSRKARQREEPAESLRTLSLKHVRAVRLLWVGRSQQGRPPLGRLQVGRRGCVLGPAAKSIDKSRKSRDPSLR